MELLSLFEKHQFKIAIVDLGQLGRIQSFAISKQDGVIYKFDLRDELLIFDRYVDHYQYYLLVENKKWNLSFKITLVLVIQRLCAECDASLSRKKRRYCTIRHSFLKNFVARFNSCSTKERSILRGLLCEISDLFISSGTFLNTSYEEFDLILNQSLEHATQCPLSNEEKQTTFTVS